MALARPSNLPKYLFQSWELISDCQGFITQSQLMVKVGSDGAKLKEVFSEFLYRFQKSFSLSKFRPIAAPNRIEDFDALLSAGISLKQSLPINLPATTLSSLIVNPLFLDSQYYECLSKLGEVIQQIDLISVKNPTTLPKTKTLEARLAEDYSLTLKELTLAEDFSKTSLNALITYSKKTFGVNYYKLNANPSWKTFWNSVGVKLKLGLLNSALSPSTLMSEAITLGISAPDFYAAGFSISASITKASASSGDPKIRSFWVFNPLSVPVARILRYRSYTKTTDLLPNTPQENTLISAEISSEVAFEKNIESLANAMNLSISHLPRYLETLFQKQVKDLLPNGISLTPLHYIPMTNCKAVTYYVRDGRINSPLPDEGIIGYIEVNQLLSKNLSQIDLISADSLFGIKSSSANSILTQIMRNAQ